MVDEYGKDDRECELQMQAGTVKTEPLLGSHAIGERHRPSLRQRKQAADAKSMTSPQRSPV
jgi:hypothetical protein